MESGIVDSLGIRLVVSPRILYGSASVMRRPPPDNLKSVDTIEQLVLSKLKK